MILTWGKKPMMLTDDIVMVYHYTGVFWVFLLTIKLEFFRVDEEGNILEEIPASNLNGIETWGRIHFMDRFGLLVFFAILFIVASVYGG